METVLLPVGTWLATTSLDEVLGFASSIIALLGVPAALWQARHARTAAEAARAATVTLRRKLGLLDAVQRLAVNVARLDEVQERLSAGTWSGLAGVVLSTRRDLVVLQGQRNVLSSQDHPVLQEVIGSLQDLEMILRANDPADREARAMKEMQRRLLVKTDGLLAILVGLHRRNAGEENGEPA